MMRVSDTVPYGNGINMKNTAKQVAAPDRSRLDLPVCVYLIEHPRGLVLVDTGWCREISPEGEYEPGAVRKVLPAYLAVLYHPWLPKGMAVHEQLGAMVGEAIYRVGLEGVVNVDDATLIQKYIAEMITEF